MPFWTKAKSAAGAQLADRIRKLASLDQRSGLVFLQVKDDSNEIAAALLALSQEDYAEALRDLLKRPNGLFRAYHLPAAVFGTARARASLRTARDVEIVARILLQAYGRPSLRTDAAPYTFLMGPLKSLLVAAVEGIDKSDAELDNAMRALVDLLAEEHPQLGDISGRCASHLRRLDYARFESLLNRWIAANRCLGKQLHILRTGLGDQTEGFQAVLLVLLDAPQPEPTREWQSRWKAAGLLSEAPRMRDTLAQIVATGISEPMTGEGEPVSLTRGAIWALAEWRDAQTRELLESIPHSGREVPANAALWSLAQPGDDESIRRMLRVSRNVRHRGLKTRAEHLLRQTAQARQETPESLADQLVPTYGLDKDGSRTWFVDGYRVVVRLTSRGEVERVITPPDGKPVGSPPKELQDEPTGAWQEIAATTKQLKVILTEQKHRLEDAMVEGRSWPLHAWQSTIAANPVMWSLAERLVWRVRTSKAEFFAMPTDGNRSQLHTGKEIEIPADAELSLPHPLGIPPEELEGWRHCVVAAEVVQPFRQLFREVYEVTPVERQARDHSTRFAGYSVPLAQVYALTKTRGWKGKLGLAGFYGAGEGWKAFPTKNVRVCLRHGGDDPQLALGVIEEVFFERQETAQQTRKAWNRIALEDVDPVVFSEAMRDVDLIVSAASIGRQFTPREWEALRETERESWLADQPRAEYLTQATAQTRGQLLLELAPLLGIQDRVYIDGHFAVVDGRLGQYRVHLGTSSIYMEPSRHALCIVPAKKEARRLLLPFEEGDYMTSLVFSKVLMMLDDDRIIDPTILRQMGRTP